MEESSSWAGRRKTIYLAGAVLVVSTACFLVFWQFWYQAPTCSDNLKNGDEAGVDCGGTCSLICKADTLAPIVRWDPRLFEVLPKVWSAVVYVENPNIDADAVYAPYKFVIYDTANQVLYERKGATLLPKHKTVGVFEGSITLPEGSRPGRTLFELEDNVLWQKGKAEEKNISITHTPILRLTTTPRIEATVKNESLSEVKNVELVAVIFDGKDNAIAASRTFVDSLSKDQSVPVFFTWPKPFTLGEKACTKESSVVLLMDRSGSMASSGATPPEPLSSAKTAATAFVDSLKMGDMAGVLSFATEATSPIDAGITQDFTLAKSAIDRISIKTGNTQYTNIYDALHSAWGEVTSRNIESGSAKVLVLLTDGVANYPRDPEGKTEADDIGYAESLALSEAALIKADGINIYSIGLGKNINESFLKKIASKEANFFFAPDANNLLTIYKDISMDICKEVPARIEITYKILDV